MIGALTGIGKIFSVIGNLFDHFKSKRMGELEVENQILKNKIKQLEEQNEKLKQINNISIDGVNVFDAGVWK
jgi:hypothetical protein